MTIRELLVRKTNRVLGLILFLLLENTTGALRNISYGVDQNKISINVAEGVGALNKALRRATAKLENQTSAQVNQWSLVQVHAAGALWNLSRCEFYLKIFYTNVFKFICIYHLIV